MDNKLFVGLSSVGYQYSADTKHRNKSINQLLDYSATHPADGILYCSSDMVLCAHSDTGFHNNKKGRSRAGAHIFLSKNKTMPQWNGPVLTLVQIIKFVMSSASEPELGALFITAQEIAEMRNTLEEMIWPQTKSPIQKDNSDAAGVVNNNIVPRNKTMDRHLQWIR